MELVCCIWASERGTINASLLHASMTAFRNNYLPGCPHESMFLQRHKHDLHAHFQNSRPLLGAPVNPQAVSSRHGDGGQPMSAKTAVVTIARRIEPQRCADVPRPTSNGWGDGSGNANAVPVEVHPKAVSKLQTETLSESQQMLVSSLSRIMNASVPASCQVQLEQGIKMALYVVPGAFGEFWMLLVSKAVHIILCRG